MQIYPSILETDIDTFVKRVQEYAPIFAHMQIDIADGIFVQNRTIQIEDILRNISRFKLHASNKTFEFHLMVNDYEKEIGKLRRLKDSLTITTILIHLKALVLDPSTKVYLEQSREAQDDKGWDYGLVLNPDDEVLSNRKTIMQFKTVQLMTIVPGRQGNPFVPEALDKIDQLGAVDFSGKIILDGAINERTIQQILSRAHWPDAVCPGSYFNKNTQERFKILNNMLDQSTPASSKKVSK